MKDIRALFLVVIVALAAFAAPALDNTIQNDFWDTTAYVNPEPLSVQTGATDSPIDVCSPFVVVSDVLLVLDTSPLGLLLFFR